MATVVLFHLWPSLVSGGYVGVDVFFVISGFLITGMLVREAEASGRLNVLNFYFRRIRRLLPAATLVLVAVAMFVPLLPPPRWHETAEQIAASALYVQNWQLAWLANDYLGSTDLPSPVRHYWSLSIEEQLYLVWPWLIVLCVTTLVATRKLRRRRSATRTQSSKRLGRNDRLPYWISPMLFAEPILVRPSLATFWFGGTMNT